MDGSRFGPRPTSMALVAIVLSLLWATVFPGSSAGSPTVRAWRAYLGKAETDEAVLSISQGGDATLRLQARATLLAGRARYTAAIHQGGCVRTTAGLGRRLLAAKGTIATGPGGAVSRTLRVSASEAQKVRAAWESGKGAVLVMLSRAGNWCFPLAARGVPGEAVRVEDELVLTVTRAEHWAGDPRLALPAHHSFLTVHVRVTALKRVTLSEEEFLLYAEDGSIGGIRVAGDLQRKPAFTGRVLKAGQSIEGWITRVVDDADADHLILAWRPGRWSGLVKGDGASAVIPLGAIAMQGPDIPSPTPTPTPTPTPSASPSPSPTPTPSVSPSPTPTPTLTPTPTPTLSPSPST